MSNLDFESVLRTKFNGDPNRILENFKYNDGNAIRGRIKAADRESTGELYDIINEIVLWKINRIVCLPEDALTGLYDIKKIRSPEEARVEKREEVENLLRKLINAKGVRLAMASAFLHFFNPNVFPIFDQRAYRVIFKEDYKASLKVEKNVQLYLEYLKKCIEYHRDKLERHGIPFSQVDRYLYQLDIEAGNGVKYYG